MLSFLNKKNSSSVIDEQISAIANARMFSLEFVNDEMFAQKMMGDGVAFELHGDTIVSPCNGKLTVMFPTAHAFGITMKNGVELLIHIGINTVNNKGIGFKALKKQGDKVNVNEPIVKLDLEELRNKGFDMSAMLIITNTNNIETKFIDYREVQQGEKINR